MKCPDCEKQPIVDCEACHPCPKCGSEMEEDRLPGYWYCTNPGCSVGGIPKVKP